MKNIYKCVQVAVLVLGGALSAFAGESALSQLNAQVPGGADLKVPAAAVMADEAKAAVQLPWQHINLRSAEGVEITVDYTPALSMTGQLWVNLSGEKLLGAQKVQVVLLNLYKDYIYAGTVQSSQYLVLASAGRGKYTGQAKNVALTLGAQGGSYFFRQEIAVRITTVTASGELKDEWLTDPVSGSHNFKFELSRF